MTIRFTDDFLDQYKRVNVRIRRKMDEHLKIFKTNPNNPQLNNHALTREWEGYRSIDINSDWRLIYKDVKKGDEVVVYLVAIGTHEELYSPQ